MNQLQIFEQRELLGKQFRMYGTPDEPLFLARDVAEWIEHSDTSMMMRAVDPDEKVTKIVCTPGGDQNAWFLTEDGLYEVLMQSRKENAKLFKAEVKKVLKSIRRHGAYMTPETLDRMIASPEFGIKLLTALQEEREKNAALSEKIEQDRPKVFLAECLEVSKDAILIGDLAKLLCQNGLDIGQNRLFERLREDGYLMKSGSSCNTPTQRSMELGLMMLRETTVKRPNGYETICKTPVVTGKGQRYFVGRYVTEGARQLTI